MTSSVPPPLPQQSSHATKAIRRYGDAYLIARTINGIGNTVKVTGIILGGIIALAGLVIGSQGYSPSPVVMIGGVIIGAVVTVPLFVLGVIVSAQGQVLKASLDEAVHTSPFLTNEQRASVMSL